MPLVVQSPVVVEKLPAPPEANSEPVGLFKCISQLTFVEPDNVVTPAVSGAQTWMGLGLAVMAPDGGGGRSGYVAEPFT